MGCCSLLSLFVSICPSTISWHISSSSRSLCASFRLALHLLVNFLASLRGSEQTHRWCHRKPSYYGRTQGRFQWQGLSVDLCLYMCLCVCMCVCVCVCKIRPGDSEFQSFTRYQQWLLCCRGVSELTGLFIAFHNVPRAQSTVRVEERSQIKDLLSNRANVLITTHGDFSKPPLKTKIFPLLYKSCIMYLMNLLFSEIFVTNVFLGIKWD